MPRFMCSRCSLYFSTRYNLSFHIKTQHGEGHRCDLCNESFTTVLKLHNHRKGQHCRHCGELFDTPKLRYSHERLVHAIGLSEADSEVHDDEQFVVRLHRTALDNAVRVVRFTRKDPTTDWLLFYAEFKHLVQHHIQQLVNEKGSLKYQLRVNIHFCKSTDPTVQFDSYFNSHQRVALYANQDEVDHELDVARDNVERQIQKFTESGSGWVVDAVTFVDLHVASYTPMRGFGYIELPTLIKNKHAVVNVKNEDDKCFLWSVLASQYHVNSNADRVSSYKHLVGNLNITGIEWPMTFHNIAWFEQKNALKINVYGVQDDLSIIPIRLNRGDGQKIKLLYLEKDDQTHFCAIRSLDRLLARSNGGTGRQYFCEYCLSSHNTEDQMKDHVKKCRDSEGRTIRMPVGDQAYIKFNSMEKTLRMPLVFYADTESILRKIDTCQPSTSTSYHMNMQEHEMVMCGYTWVLQSEHVMDPIYRDEAKLEFGEGCGIRMIQSICDEFLHYVNESMTKSLVMTKQDWVAFNGATWCAICGDGFSDANPKVRDHDHVTGKYRQALHNMCNLRFQLKRQAVVVMHNFKGYDCPQLITSIGAVASKRGYTIECIPKGLNEFLSITIKMPYVSKSGKKRFNELKFIDSLAFLNASLDTLIQSLQMKGDDSFKVMDCYFGDDSKSMMRKQVMAYDYFDCIERYADTAFPTKEAFFNSLHNADVSDDDYNYAKQMYEKAGCHNLGQYYLLYMTADIAQLADVFEAFRWIALKNYYLDPVHYVSAPSFSWSAMLKFTNVTLELLRDQDTFDFIQNAIRGGVSMVSQERLVEANNKYLSDYDPTKEDVYLWFVDCVSLYSFVMMDYKLPVGNFIWLSDEEITNFDVMNVDVNANVGYILKVDLDYPYICHDVQDCYPLAPEHLEITDDMLSPYNVNIMNDMNMKHVKSKKLVPNLHDKHEYVVHAVNLQFYINHGMILKKVHCVLSFDQNNFLQSYVNHNCETRKKVQSSFEKDFYKILNNSIFGKTCQNVYNYRKCTLVTSKLAFEKLVSKPNYKASMIFSENLICVQQAYNEVYLNTPVYVGFSILDCSKHTMYRFYYDVLYKKFGDKLKLVLTDTDSALIKLTGVYDMYKELNDIKQFFDFSNFPANHLLYDNSQYKCPGKFSCETNGEVIKRFAGIRSKVYSLDTEKTVKKRLKGIAKKTVKKELSHDDYVKCLKDKEVMRHRFKAIQKNDTVLNTVEVNKISLSPLDDKRYLSSDGMNENDLNKVLEDIPPWLKPAFNRQHRRSIIEMWEERSKMINKATQTPGDTIDRSATSTPLGRDNRAPSRTSTATHYEFMSNDNLKSTTDLNGPSHQIPSGSYPRPNRNSQASITLPAITKIDNVPSPSPINCLLIKPYNTPEIKSDLSSGYDSYRRPDEDDTKSIDSNTSLLAAIERQEQTLKMNRMSQSLHEPQRSSSKAMDDQTATEIIPTINVIDRNATL